jgi:hypothetical protein
VSRLARLACAGLLFAAVAVFLPIAAADPEEVDPDLAKRDQDYAAGKQAVDAKDWPQAVQLFLRAETRNPDNADCTTCSAIRIAT